MKAINRIAVLVILGAALPMTSIYACQPCRPRETDEAIKSAYAAADNIFVATVENAERSVVRVDYQSFSENVPQERVLFRVDRVYKGDIKPGDSYETVTKLGCNAANVANDPSFVDEVNERGELKPMKLSSRWLIYEDKRFHNLSLCSSMPVELVKYELPLLEKLGKKSRKNNSPR